MWCQPPAKTAMDGALTPDFFVLRDKTMRYKFLKYGIYYYICITKKAVMKVRYEDKELEQLYQKGESKKYKKIARDKKLLDRFVSVINSMKRVENCDDLKLIPSLHYEKLKYQYSGKSSVRLSNSFVGRLIFTEENGGISVNILEIDDTHYGNKK